MKMLRVIPILLLLFITACGTSGSPTVTAQPTPTTVAPTDTATTPPIERPPVEIVLSFVGDCTFGAINDYNSDAGFAAVYKRSGSLTYPFDLVRHIFAQDDLTIINFEGTLTTAVETADKEFHFRGDSGYAHLLPAASVEAVLLSNNHSRDYLEQGFADTLEALTAADVPAIYENVPLVTAVQGVEVVIIGDCSVIGENITYTEGVSERVLAQLEQYKTPQNLVVVNMHWGSEGAQTPSAWQQASARDWIDAGADLVIGQHAHNVQGIELYNGKYIVYSLGNFAFGGNGLSFSKETFIAQMTFTVAADGTRQSALTVVPCYTSSAEAYNANGVLKNNYQPIPVHGEAAEAVRQLLLERSAALPDGVSDITIEEG